MWTKAFLTSYFTAKVSQTKLDFVVVVADLFICFGKPILAHA